MESGTGVAGAKEIYRLLKRTKLLHMPKFISFDTTNTMSGRKKGINVELEKKLTCYGASTFIFNFFLSHCSKKKTKK